jgi:hypothetical protein
MRKKLSARYWRKDAYLELKRALSLGAYDFKVEKLVSSHLINVCFVCRKRKKTQLSIWFYYDDPEADPEYNTGISAFIDICSDPNCNTYARFLVGA